jgi:transcriptional regulator GlxA family with amidase domain
MTKSVQETIQDPRVHAGVTLIHQQLPSSSIDIDEIAGAVNLSSSHFRHLFQRHLGITPARYHKLLRLQKAQDLLQESFLTVKQVMAAVGWRDESHFSRDFKRAYGRSPSKERQVKVTKCQTTEPQSKMA